MGWSLREKRAMDLMVLATVIVVLAVFLLVVAAAVRPQLIIERGPDIKPRFPVRFEPASSTVP